MIPIIVPPVDELWDERARRFLTFSGCTLQLEHSLISISKWEGIWGKAFFKNIKKLTIEEYRSYIQCMTLNKTVDPLAYYCLTSQNFNEIVEYMNKPMTAVDFSSYNDVEPPGKKDTITAEVIYYKMARNSIPFECEKWHINRLIALIRVFDMKDNPDKKVGVNAMINKYARMNEARKKMWHTKG